MPDTDTFVPAIYRRKPLIPDGKTIIKENDEIYFLAAESDIDGIVQEMRLQDTSSSNNDCWWWQNRLHIAKGLEDD